MNALATRFYAYGYAVPIFLRDLHRSTPIPPRNQVTFWVGRVPLAGPHSIGMQN